MPDHHQNNEGLSHHGAWITIGSFDGVHKGHQRIIQKLVEGAHLLKQPAVVVTFFPHPAVVLRETKGPYYLTTPQEKLGVFKMMGADSVLTLHFDKELSRMNAEKFMALLHHRLHFSCLLIGYDFHLGADREGDIHKLHTIGENLGYSVRSVSPLKRDSQPVSSSRIREFIQKGDVKTAADHLGRYYAMQGTVVPGDGRGKQIGLPTANIQSWERKIVPAAGVYAAFVKLFDKRYPSVVNIGNRPTFYDQPVERTIEVHILDFDQDIYALNLELFFVEWIRAEEKFDATEKLLKQIRKDIEHAREVLSNAPTKKNLFA